MIAAEGVSKSFGELAVLKDVSLPVRRGEVVCVVGPSGSGKTTLLRTLALLEVPSAGRVTMDGIVISDGLNASGVRKAAAKVRPDIGMVFQHFNLWPHRSVIENVIEAPILVRRMRRQDAIELAMELLEKVGLADKRDVYPARLSGGQQQRVAIARALAMRPRIMLFDEATSALDPELRHEVLRVMRQLAEDGMTMLVVTHEMGFARSVGSRIVFMDSGAIMEDTLPETFFTAPGTERAVRFLRQLQD
ncbi:amino acid ABC transporter ATP-binding protein [Aureimonas altamirensis]|nr:amino acid ABC transporter ATP-binding protein [Aureimonas altamirensis]